MQILRTLSLSLLLTATAVNSNIYGQADATAAKYAQTPDKTVFIKHPAAEDVATFFSTNKTFLFEIFKPGTKEDLAKIIAVFKKDSNVESCTEGTVTSDYYAVHVIVKTAKDKMWYASLFKKAGINTIKINNHPIVEVEKM
jgi:hypothetical protein